MITKSYHKPNTYYLFRDDNTEIEFVKFKGVPARFKGNKKFTQKDKEIINEYFRTPKSQQLK